MKERNGQSVTKLGMPENTLEYTLHLFLLFQDNRDMNLKADCKIFK